MLILPWRNLKRFKCRSLKTQTFFCHTVIFSANCRVTVLIPLLYFFISAIAFFPLLHLAVGKKNSSHPDKIITIKFKQPVFCRFITQTLKEKLWSSPKLLTLYFISQRWSFSRSFLHLKTFRLWLSAERKVWLRKQFTPESVGIIALLSRVR